MTTVVLSDVHGNLSALQAVLNDVFLLPGIEEFWYLGDAVGYGPWPYQVWSELRNLGIREGAWLAGNHEWGLLGRLAGRRQLRLGGEIHALGFYSRLAWPILDLHKGILRGQSEMLEHLASLPVMSTPRAGVYLAHGAFTSEEEVSVIRYSEFPILNSAELKALGKDGKGGQPLLLATGHTHKPGIWQLGGDEERWEELSSSQRIDLENLETRPIFFNPGSVGFPRNGDGRACYALLDWASGYLELKRVWYSQKQVRDEMNKVFEYRALLTEGFLPECRIEQEEDEACA